MYEKMEKGNELTSNHKKWRLKWEHWKFTSKHGELNLRFSLKRATKRALESE
jgi:hypothetical protein